MPDVKPKTLIAAGILLLGWSATPEAKFVSQSLTIDGPGMQVPGVIGTRRAVDRVYAATLVGSDRGQVKRPLVAGPAYRLVFVFGVGDENGSRTANIRQTLYPFAPGGAVVRTPGGQRIDMSYGPVRFAPRWFEVPDRVLRELQSAGLPSSEPERHPAVEEREPLAPSSSRWPWLVGIAVLTACGAGAIWRRLRRHRPGALPL
jgi:hypothetical protein